MLPSSPRAAIGDVPFARTAIGIDDEPPPYSAVVPRDHVGWSYYDFPCGSSRLYASDIGATVPLRTDSSSVEPEGPSIPCRLFICGSGRTVLGIGGDDMDDDGDDVPDTKDDDARVSRRYGAILVGGAVIIFLMVLSILVRFVMDKSLWRS